MPYCPANGCCEFCDKDNDVYYCSMPMCPVLERRRLQSRIADIVSKPRPTYGDGTELIRLSRALRNNLLSTGRHSENI